MSKNATSSSLCMYITVITVIRFITNSIDRFSEAGKNGNIYQILPFITFQSVRQILRIFLRQRGEYNLIDNLVFDTYSIFSKPMLEIGILAITEFNLKNRTTIFVFIKRIYHQTYQLNEILINIIDIRL